MKKLDRFTPLPSLKSGLGPAWIFSVLVACGTMWPDGATAQTPTCSQVGDKIEKFEQNDVDLTIDATGAVITTCGDNEHGISGHHEGTGDVTINADEGTITTSGKFAYGIHGLHGRLVMMPPTTGNLTIDANEVTITTSDSGAVGIHGRHSGKGNLTIDADEVTITTSGFESLGIYGWHRGNDNLTIDADEVTITTQGERAHGIDGQHHKLAGMPSTTGNLAIDATGAKITTSGAYAYGISGFHSSTGDVTINADDVEITTQGERAHGIDGWHQMNGNLAIDATDVTITTSGTGAYGISGYHGGTGDVTIDATGAEITTSGDNAHGIFGDHRGTGDVGLNVNGGRIVACDAQDPDHPADCQGRGIVAKFGNAMSQPGEATVDITGAVIKGHEAVVFEGGRGILNLTDSSVVGNILFADGDYNDELTIKLDRFSRKFTATDIHFGNGDDMMTVDIAAGQHLDLDGVLTGITGLETLTKKGGGAVRFASGVSLSNGGVLNLDDGVLVLAGLLDLKGGTLTIKDAGKLVFEVRKVDADDQGRFGRWGQIFAGELHFADGQNEPFFVQLSKDPDTQIAGVLENLDGLPLLDGIKVKKGDDPDVRRLDLRSRSGDGTERVVGTIEVGLVDGIRIGTVDLDDGIESQIGQLVLPGELTTSSGTTDTTPSPPPSIPVVPEQPPVEPTPMEPSSPEDGSDPDPEAGMTPTDGDTGDDTDGSEMPSDPAPGSDGADPPGDKGSTDAMNGDADDGTDGSEMPGDAAPAATASSGGSGGVGIIGLGLLAVLLASFSADDEASAAGLAGSAFGSPQSAYLAEASARGILTLRETGNQPYRMWIRTSQGAQSLPMTGVAGTGVDGTEVGFNLYGSDRFYLGASVAPNVTARVDSLNLAAEGTVHALSSGWRSDHAFAGLRLSQGDFRVDALVANPMVNGALFSQARLRNTQVQLRTGLNLNAGALRFTPSASIQMGSLEQGAHVAESTVLRANVPAFKQDYTSYQLGLKMSSEKWLDLAGGGQWQPQLKLATIRTNSGGGGG